MLSTCICARLVRCLLKVTSTIETAASSAIRRLDNVSLVGLTISDAGEILSNFDSFDFFFLYHFYAPQLYRQVLLRRVLAMGILSVCLSVRPSVRPSVCPSRPGTDSRPSEIETLGLHRMIAQSL